MHTPAVKSTLIARARGVERIFAGIAATDGAGVRLTRVIPQPLQHRLDPFLMMDAFATDDPDDYIAGFPDHPHRGFETVTYMIAGRMRHRDTGGHEGLLENGGMQWMTAGRGLVHSEIPEQQDGRMEGFQLWLNLPARDKLIEPWYRDFQAADLPRFLTDEHVTVTVIAGESHGVAGAVTRAATEPLYLDVHLPEGATFAQPIAPAHTAFAYVYRGEIEFAGTRVTAGRMAILANDERADGALLRAATQAKALLIAGRPLREPIVQYGPFVMNTREQIFEAMRDFEQGRFE